MISATVNGTAVEVANGSSILDACRAAGVDLPTLCHGPTMAPANACRVCVVELEGSRTLVPSCSRVAEEGMSPGPDQAQGRQALSLLHLEWQDPG